MTIMFGLAFFLYVTGLLFVFYGLRQIARAYPASTALRILFFGSLFILGTALLGLVFCFLATQGRVCG